MDFNIEVRKKQLQSLDQYITSSKDKVQSILDYLGWNSRKVLEKEPGIPCSVNSNHAVALKNIDTHFSKCIIKSSGYQSDDEFLSEPVNHPLATIKLDHAMKIQILNKARENDQKFRTAWNGQDSDPMTSDRMYSTYSPDERLTLYDYCVQNTVAPPVPSEFNLQIDDKKEDTILSHKELLAMERNAKRRRIKYKSVHTGRNKSHSEVLREVIENQMEQYKDYLASKTEINENQINSQIDEQHLCPISINKDNDITTLGYTNINERRSSSVGHHSNHSSSSRHKKDCSKYERPYKMDNHDTSHRDDYKNYERHKNRRRHDYSPIRESKKRHGNDAFRHSKEKREWYNKLERH